MAQKCIKHTLSLRFLLGLQEIIVTSCTSLTISVCKFFHYDGVRVNAKVVVLNMINASMHYLFTGIVFNAVCRTRPHSSKMVLGENMQQCSA